MIWPKLFNHGARKDRFQFVDREEMLMENSNDETIADQALKTKNWYIKLSLVRKAVASLLPISLVLAHKASTRTNEKRLHQCKVESHFINKTNFFSIKDLMLIKLLHRLTVNSKCHCDELKEGQMEIRSGENYQMFYKKREYTDFESW